MCFIYFLDTLHLCWKHIRMGEYWCDYESSHKVGIGCVRLGEGRLGNAGSGFIMLVDALYDWVSFGYTIGQYNFGELKLLTGC